MPWLSAVSALLHCYLGGEAGASATAMLLTGAANPCGKLAESYPLLVSDNPSYRFFSDDRHNVEYRESIYVGYRYYDAAEKEVLFPFGFYFPIPPFHSGLQVSSGTFTAGQTLTVSVQVQNTGSAPGAEIVQCYCKEDLPVKRLCGFGECVVTAGRKQASVFTLTDKDFSFYSNGG